MTTHESLCQDYRRVDCDIECAHAAVETSHYDAYLSTYQRLFVANTLVVEELPQNGTSSLALVAANSSIMPTLKTLSSNINFDLCLADTRLPSLVGNKSCAVSCRLAAEQPDCVAGTVTFWTFVCLMCLGTIGFNVANCVSDATCFDMLGGLSPTQYKSSETSALCAKQTETTSNIKISITCVAVVAFWMLSVVVFCIKNIDFKNKSNIVIPFQAKPRP